MARINQFLKDIKKYNIKAKQKTGYSGGTQKGPNIPHHYSCGGKKYQYNVP